jgi:hypothetical protein
MASYNFLRMGADLVNAAGNAAQADRANEELAAKKAHYQSDMLANNALVELRQKQSGKLDREEMQAEEMRKKYAGFNIDAPDALQNAVQMGDPKLAEFVFKRQQKERESFLIGLNGSLKGVMSLKTPEEKQMAHEKLVESMSAMYPQAEVLKNVRYSDDLYRALSANSEAAIAKNNNEGVTFIKGADGRIYPADRSTGQVGEGQGPAEKPKPEKPDSGAAKLAYEKSKDAMAAKAAYDRLSTMSQKEKDQMRFMNGKDFNDLEQLAAQHRITAKPAPADKPIAKPAATPAQSTTKALNYTNTATQKQKDEFMQAYQRAEKMKDQAKLKAVISRARERGVVE